MLNLRYEVKAVQLLIQRAFIGGKSTIGIRIYLFVSSRYLIDRRIIRMVWLYLNSILL